MEQRKDYNTRKHIDDLIFISLKNNSFVCDKTKNFNDLENIFNNKISCECRYFVKKCCHSGIRDLYFTIKEKINNYRK